MARRGKIEKGIEPLDEAVRPVRSKKYVYFMLIVCEDQNTEPVYFKQFEELFDNLLPEETVYVKRVGTGRNSFGVVKAAIDERARIYEDNNHRNIDEAWVVFDKDDLDQTPGNRINFESAFELAEKEKINVAYSNECFELWLLLHFIDVNPSLTLPRQEIYKQLSEAINASLLEGEKQFEYVHGSADVVDYVSRFGDEASAMTRADVLKNYHIGLSHTPIESNPVTYVDVLVQSLRAWYRYYSYED